MGEGGFTGENWMDSNQSVMFLLEVNSLDSKCPPNQELGIQK